MTDSVPIDFPAGYATAVALGYVGESGHLALIDAARPMPVAVTRAAVPTALAGTVSGAGQAGPFAPAPGVPVILQLSGEWTGTVSLLRSTDGGSTRVPITAGGEPWGVFSANACEAVWIDHDSAAELYLSFDIVQGAADYRVSQ